MAAIVVIGLGQFGRSLSIIQQMVSLVPPTQEWQSSATGHRFHEMVAAIIIGQATSMQQDAIMLTPQRH